jgi:hypothetical protein
MRTRIPIPLKLVGWIFILGGISAAIEILIDASNGRTNLNFGVLGVFIGIGLLRLRTGWRTLALVLLVIALVFIPILSVLALSTPGNLSFNIFGQKVAALAVFFVFTFWQFRVLLRPDVRALFLNRRGNKMLLRKRKSE